MKNRFMICIMSMFIVTAMVHAGLWDPAIINHSFETVENGQTGLSGWGYVIDDWFEYPDGDGDISVFWEDGASIELPECDGVLWVGFQTGGTVYQAIGTVDDGATYVVTALIGDRPADVFGTGVLSLYASSSEDDGADEVDLASFATLLDSVEVTMTDGTFVTEYIREVQVLLSTGTGYAGQILWLQIKDAVGKDYFDNIRIELDPAAYNPNPADGAIGVPLDKVFTWNTGPDPTNLTQPNPLVTKHYVYMSSGNPADPNMTLVKTIDAGSPPAPTAQYDPPQDLLRDGVYFWRVDEGIGDASPSDPNDIIPGHIWTFEAVTSRPILDPTLPVDVVVYAGEDVSFSVNAMNPFTFDDTGMSYAWYKVGDSTILSNTTTLDIPEAQIADDGGYYCTVTLLSSGLSSDSIIAALAIKRAIGHWKLDGDALDSSDLQNHGTVIGGGSQQTWWEDGKDGEAINVGGGNIEGIPYVEVAAADADVYNLTKRISVSVWVKSPGSPNGYGVLVGKQLDNVSRPWMLRQNFESPWITWKTHDSFDAFPDVMCFDDHWHHVVVTWDIDTGEKKAYMDGQLKGTLTGFNYEGLSTDDSPVRIGYYYSTYYFKGLLDDARIYNYALTPYEIAVLYTDFVPGAEVCIENPAYDLNEDCVVDVLDLGVLLEHWMDCNIYPICIN
jgi:hypothetical protein